MTCIVFSRISFLTMSSTAAVAAVCASDAATSVAMLVAMSVATLFAMFVATDYAVDVAAAAAFCCIKLVKAGLCSIFYDMNSASCCIVIFLERHFPLS